MARFILDIANLEEEKIMEVCNTVVDTLCPITSGVITIVCIDKTNDNQFHDDPNEGSNKLTEEQINKFNNLK